ncbi:hypothetical protein Glove_476g59 [Diversispora epigaea]|uniref:Protein kinase domain-containing protein n=1 Tax=Diversispora epigaea TaxID=1348612 RepID=A0A397GQ52_9GLOM|nr:hypothetical protein Glove_476g59 [Diversispora epigaea]
MSQGVEKISIVRQDNLQWIPYDEFKEIKHIADGGRESVYSAKLKNGMKVALKEKDSRFDIV